MEQIQETNITLLKSPVTTVRYFSKGIIYHMFKLLTFKMIMFIFMLCGLFVFIKNNDLTDYTVFYSKWIIYGFLTSAGIGFGLNTGLLYLFPFVTNVALQTIECGNLQFDTWGANALVCQDNSYRVERTHSFFILLKVILPVWLWGLGTALGELTSFFLAQKISHDGGSIENYILSSNPIISGVNNMIVRYLQRYGFMTIFFMASWPNMLFDMAGLAAGFYGISLLTFLKATILGKAFIKAPLQSFVIIAIVNKSSIIPRRLQNYIESLNSSDEQSWIALIWSCMTILLLGVFVKAFIETIARNEYRRRV